MSAKILRWVAWFVLGLLLLVMGLVLLFRFVNPPTSAFMLTYKVSNPSEDVRQEWVPYERISAWMPLAVVASEDQRFPDHWGVDFRAIRHAVSEYIDGDGLRGASTITQQTAKNLFLWNGRSFVRKALEAGLALTLEAFWSKQRILEVYLNVAEFGPGIYGVGAASQAFFGIPASQLSQTQAAMLAAVLPNPRILRVDQPTSYVWERVRWIRRQMAQLGAGYLKRL
ncbi:monofunctional biosynthetic peptidoglycan transglycosylase [Marinobacter koreensis]|uniref:Biosynthetic peptidoglycan transglycosylase n=1 Tax=Marinobacter koreensis TaxID=335974 RepID=A0ABW0RMF0_9GAMM|nr:monofunctional biosynthetic peptidoglycan transglycosylase [Marinobacter koreensis]MCK7546736.1 monofunctional biosynthetic peptidoglycan transglycosylase [Marinobacter koreensis]MDX1818304.1 monofunctional biosynthetic peptidoglycan transglycosylase [Marinobacter sp.]